MCFLSDIEIAHAYNDPEDVWIVPVMVQAGLRQPLGIFPLAIQVILFARNLSHIDGDKMALLAVRTEADLLTYSGSHQTQTLAVGCS